MEAGVEGRPHHEKSYTEEESAALQRQLLVIVAGDGELHMEEDSGRHGPVAAAQRHEDIRPQDAEELACATVWKLDEPAQGPPHESNPDQTTQVSLLAGDEHAVDALGEEEAAPHPEKYNAPAPPPESDDTDITDHA